MLLCFIFTLVWCFHLVQAGCMLGIRGIQTLRDRSASSEENSFHGRTSRVAPVK